MEEVVSPLRHGGIYPALVDHCVDPHPLQPSDDLIVGERIAERLVDLFDGAGGRLLEVVGNGYLFAELRLFGKDHLDRKNLIPHIRHVAGDDRGGEQEILQSGSAELDEEFIIPLFNRADRGAVDHRREGQGLTFVIVQVWKKRVACVDVPVLLPLGMDRDDLPQGELLLHPQRDELRLIGVGSPVVHRVGDQG